MRCDGYSLYARDRGMSTWDGGSSMAGGSEGEGYMHEMEGGK